MKEKIIETMLLEDLKNYLYLQFNIRFSIKDTI